MAFKRLLSSIELDARLASIVLLHALTTGSGSVRPDVSVIALPRHLHADECSPSPR